jgi:hypothetical protein
MNASTGTCRPIIVLGIDRSGTSLVTELIYRWGAYVGDFALNPSNENPQGFWEYQPMQDFMTELQVSTQMWEWNPEFKKMISDRAFDPQYRERALALIASMEEKGTPWVWKEPELCLFLPFWEKLWTRPVYVVTVRNPHDSAASFEKIFLTPKLQERARLTAYFALRWQHFMLEILEHTEKGITPTLFVSYEELMRSPVEQCRRLWAFLNAQTGIEDEEGERLEAMFEAINPGLWRNKKEISFYDVPEASGEQKELFRYLQGKTRDKSEPFDPSRYPMPPCAREYLENFSLFVAFLAKQPLTPGIAAERERTRQRSQP